MRPALTIVLATALAAVLLPATASAGPSAAGVRVLDCRTGPAASDRRATFRAVAKRVGGARRMWIRLRLEERTPHGHWRAVDARGLGVWRKSRAGVGQFAIRQRVLALAEGLSYRVVARIRWYGADGKLLLRARRRSRACRQAGDLPNLVVRRTVAGPPSSARGGVAAYRVEVTNRGRAPARASSVRLAVDGDVVDTVPVPALAPGATASVQATGPPCGFALVAKADAADVVREADERDNALSVPCGPS